MSDDFTCCTKLKTFYAKCNTITGNIIILDSTAFFWTQNIQFYPSKIFIYNGVRLPPPFRRGWFWDFHPTVHGRANCDFPLVKSDDPSFPLAPPPARTLFLKAIFLSSPQVALLASWCSGWASKKTNLLLSSLVLPWTVREWLLLLTPSGLGNTVVGGFTRTNRVSCSAAVKPSEEDDDSLVWGGMMVAKEPIDRRNQVGVCVLVYRDIVNYQFSLRWWLMIALRFCGS